MKGKSLKVNFQTYHYWRGKRAMKEENMKKRNVLILLILGFVILGIAGCGKRVEKEKKRIRVSPYIRLEFEGGDNAGRIVNAEFDAKQMLNENKNALDGASEKEILRLLEESFLILTQNGGHLKNGENVKILWNIDEDALEEFEKEYNVKIIAEDFSYVVDGLTSMETADLFQGIEVVFEGVSPNGTARLNNESKFRDLRYEIDQTRGLANGDVVTVTVSHSYKRGSLADVCAEKYGIIPETNQKQFTVSGLSALVTDLSMVSAESIQRMDELICAEFSEEVKKWQYPENYQGMTYMGPVLAAGERTNTLYLVYKVDTDSMKDGPASFYVYGRRENLIADSEGNVPMEAEQISLPASTFYINMVGYKGYRTYGDLERIFYIDVNKKVTDQTDRSVITAVTHVPKDYGKVTATPAFDADCFTYNVTEGSPAVTGFTQKGYDLLHSYTKEDCVRVLLPEKTAKGEKIEGFSAAWLQKEKGEYSISNALDEEAPCIELVCPDTYSTFYGFHSTTDASYKVRNIVLGKGIKTLKMSAFSGCTGLRSITLPDGIETIPQNAFYRCRGLTTVILPKNLKSIGENAFFGCENLKEMTLPDTVQSIGLFAFEGCSSLTIPRLEITGREIGGRAFGSVTIEELVLSSDLTNNPFASGHGLAFTAWRDANIEKITIGPKVTKLPDHVFARCTTVKEVEVPEGVTEIGKGAFFGCTALERITLPSSLQKIANDALQDCGELTICAPKGSVAEKFAKEKGFAFEEK